MYNPNRVPNDLRDDMRNERNEQAAVDLLTRIREERAFDEFTVDDLVQGFVDLSREGGIGDEDDRIRAKVQTLVRLGYAERGSESGSYRLTDAGRDAE